MVNLILFKNNLRINDNPALYFGSNKANIIPVFIYDEFNTTKKIGAASKYWLYHALDDLNKSLRGNLLAFSGDTISILNSLFHDYHVDNIFCEEPFLSDDLTLFNKIKNLSNSLNIGYNELNCNLLFKPYDISKDDKSPYKVFTPFYRKACENIIVDLPLGSPKNLSFQNTQIKTKLGDLFLLDSFNWYEKFKYHWVISESGALSLLANFVNSSVYNYKKGRDYPSLKSNSRLSPYIRFGMVSVNRIWHEINNLEYNENTIHFKSELGWREFSYYLLYHFPELKNKNLNIKFDEFDWENCPKKISAWKKGETGYPIIDAGMKELWETGYMHNRIRMVVASFLVKNLSVDWRIGESWFWDCLLDADYASNVASWQWVAGTGADAAPYFRIFNPILQGQKFDSNGAYTLKYLPMLNKIPIKFLQKPWEYNDGSNYFKPIVNYKESRANALLKYSLIN